MNNSKKILTRCISAATLSACIAGGAQAFELEEIVVTATKRATALTDTPQSILALTSDSLDNRDVVGFNDLIEQTPSATYSQGFNPISASLSFRGIPAATDADGTVATYIDDAPFALAGSSVAPSPAMFDLERVEILRGPQGTLYGQGSMGGTIRLITADPDSAEFYGKARVSYADVNEGGDNTSADLMLNIPLVEDVLAARIVYSTSELGGFIDDPGVPAGFLGAGSPALPGQDDINDGDSDDLRVKVLFTPSDQVTLKYMFLDSEQSIQNDNSVTFGTDPADYQRVTFGSEDNTWNSEFQMHSLSASVDLDWATLDNSLNYLDYDYLAITDIAGFINGYQSLASESITNELRLTSNSDGPWGWIAGYYFQDGESEIANDFIIFGSSIGETVALLESESHSVFGEVSREFADGLVEVLVGVRYFEDKREFSESIAGVSLPAKTERFESVNPRFNVTFRPTEDSLYYLNIAKGFRSGKFGSTIQVVTANPAVTGLDPSVVKPDSLVTYEIGTKWTLLDGSMTLEAAAYFTDWEDVQLQPQTPGGFGAVVNVGDAEILGLDLALAYATPIKGLTLNLTASYIDSEYTSVDPGVQRYADLLRVPNPVNPTVTIPAPYTSTITEGESVGAVPKTSATVSLDYIGAAYDNGINLFVNTTYAYRSRQNDLSGFSAESGVQNDLSLRLGLETLDSWKVTLFGRNLLDERGVLASSYATFVGIPRPREIGVSLDFNF